MRRYCTACRAVVEGQFLCPRCGRATAESADVPVDSNQQAADPQPSSSQSQLDPASRLLAGVLTAQGLAMGLRHLLSAIGSPTTLQINDPPLAFVLALTVLPASAVASAGHPLGILIGLLTGICHTVLLLGPSYFPQADGPPSPQVFTAAGFAIPIGLIGGLIGIWYWRPAPNLAAALSASRQPMKNSSGISTPEPWAWDRILIGALIAAVGVLSAHIVRDLLVRVALGVDRELARFAAFFIGLLALFLGAVICASGTRAGLRQGLVGGFLAAGIIAFAGLTFDLSPAPLHYLAILWGLAPPEGPMPPTAFAAFLVPAVLVGAGGGVFGSILMPPISARKSRRVSTGNI